MNQLPGSRIVCPSCGLSVSPSAWRGLCQVCLAAAVLEPLKWVAEPVARQPVSLLVGNYELLEEIGRGAMGVVWRARQKGLNRVVAVKLLLAGSFALQNVRERFYREAQAVAALHHPNIVAIHEVGEHEGQPYFSMDLILGYNLSARLREALPGIREAAQWIATLADAVEHAHGRGVVHRDLKPANILIDELNTPYLTDFGLAKLLDGESDLTLTGEAIGTVSYMPPEQAGGRNAEIGPAADVYALGALLYHLLTGRPPFLGDSSAAVLRQVIEEDPVGPCRLNPAVPRDIETICLKCLEKSPSQRYASARELADEVNRWLQGKPIKTRPLNLLHRTTRWVTRRPLLAGLLAALALSLCVGTTGSLHQAHRAKLQATRAERLASEESRQRGVAESANLQLNRALELMEIQQAESFFAVDNSPSALATLASLLRKDPSNRIAAERVVAALSCRSFIIPFGSLSNDQSGFVDARFAPGDHHVAMVSEDGTARIFDIPSSRFVGKTITHRDLKLVKFSHCGRLLATIGGDSRVRVWDWLTGGVLAEFPCEAGHPWLEHARRLGPISFLDFSPDNESIVVPQTGSSAMVWRIRSGEALTPPLRHARLITAAQFSPDGSKVVTASEDTTARLWNAQDGRELAEWKHNGLVRGAWFSPDGSMVVTICDDGTARIWDVGNAKAKTPYLRHQDFVSWANFSQDGQILVTSAFDATAKLWDVNSGQPLSPPLHHDDIVRVGTITRDNLAVATVTEHGMVRLWDASTGLPIAEPRTTTIGLRFARVGADGRIAASFADLNEVWFWDLQAGSQQSLIAQHNSPLCSAKFSPDGLRVVTASCDHSLRLWDAHTGHCLATMLGHRSNIRMVEFSSDGTRLVSGCESDDNTARLWNGRTGTPLAQPLDHPRFVTAACFSLDGETLVTGCADGKVRFWSTRSSEMRGPSLDHQDIVWSVQLSPDQRTLLTSSSDNTAQLWDVAGRRPLRKLPHDAPVKSARFSPDGTRVVTASSDRTSIIWDSGSGTPVCAALRHDWGIEDAVFSPDGKLVATASIDKTARIWDAQSGRLICEPIRHRAKVNSVRFGSDAHRLVTASEDGTCRIWDSQTGLPLSEAFAHPCSAKHAEFSSDGQRLVVARDDGTARIYNVPAPPPPVPAWLPELAEAIAGCRKDEHGMLIPVSVGELHTLRKILSASASEDFYGLWARWFFSDRSLRTVSAFSPETTPDYVRKLINTSSLHDLREAVRLSPTNVLALERLAMLISQQPEHQNPRRTEEAGFFYRRAAEVARQNEQDARK